MQHRREGDADDRSLGREEASDRLDPRLLTRRVQELVTTRGELLARGGKRVEIANLRAACESGQTPKWRVPATWSEWK